MGEWRYSSTILDLSTKWRWVVSFTPRPLYPRGNRPQYPLNRRLGEPQSRSGRCAIEKNFLPVLGIEPGRPACIPSLYRLSYPGSLENPKVTQIRNRRDRNPRRVPVQNEDVAGPSVLWNTLNSVRHVSGSLFRWAPLLGGDWTLPPP
jgi:hypothetical protein